MGVFDKMAEAGHEQVIFCRDRVTGTRAIIAIHDTTLGPARGGTRYKVYESEDSALDDVPRQTDYVWAIDERYGGTGTSTPLTARGVLAGIGAALAELDGSPELAGRHVAVQGLGGVGAQLAELLVAAGSRV